MRALSTGTGSSLGPTGGRGRSLRKWKSHRKGVSRSSRFSCAAHKRQGACIKGAMHRQTPHAPPRPRAAVRPSRLPAWQRRCERAALVRRAGRWCVRLGDPSNTTLDSPWGVWWTAPAKWEQHNVPPGACAALLRHAPCARGAQPEPQRREELHQAPAGVDGSTHGATHLHVCHRVSSHGSVNTCTALQQWFCEGGALTKTAPCSAQVPTPPQRGPSPCRVLLLHVHVAATAERWCRAGRAASARVCRPAARCFLSWERGRGAC